MWEYARHWNDKYTENVKIHEGILGFRKGKLDSGM